jgi:DNA-directed RNA polymerase subunit RPC12/RpoP
MAMYFCINCGEVLPYSPTSNFASNVLKPHTWFKTKTKIFCPNCGMLNEIEE